LKPFFTKQEIKNATKIYIQTKSQNIDTSNHNEPSLTHSLAIKEKSIPFFLNKVFKEEKEDKYYLVLADSGMGKTTFIINLFLKYSKKIFKTYQIYLIPLGHPKCFEKIDNIQNKENSILLLDAFDEDQNALKDYKKRLEDIIEKTMDFQCIIITSRSQFFHSDKDIPKDTGFYKFGGDKGTHSLGKIYLSPFDKKDVKKYLRKKYFFDIFKRKMATKIVEKSQNIMFRPMLLSYIDDLVEKKEPYEYSYEIYEEMVEKWVQRERVVNKDELKKFSKEIAIDIYNNKEKRGALFIENTQFIDFANKKNIKLEEFEMRSRSLLNRNAEGEYKFAHKSILEYFLAVELINNKQFRKNFNFENLDQCKKFYDEMFFSKITVPFFRNRNLNVRYKLKINQDWKKLTEVNIKNLINVLAIDLSNNQITDLQPLKGLTNIKWLYLSNNQITDIQPLKDLTNIIDLSLSNNQITDLQPLKGLTNIKWLYLSNNQITDIQPLKDLTNIKSLYLSNNQITDIEPLKNLNNIELLYLSNNPISKNQIKELKECLPKTEIKF